MATTKKGIWKHPKTQNWIARYKGAEGKWLNRSTGTADADEAERVAADWKLQADREASRKVADVSPSGIADAVAQAERLARTGKMDAQSARDVVNRILAASGQETLDAITNRKHVGGWVANKAATVSKPTLDKYKRVERYWLDYLGAKADRPMEVVGRNDTVGFRDKFAGEGLSPNTVNQFIDILASIYAAAVDDGHLGRNPWKKIGKLVEKTEDVGRLPFTGDDIRTLLKATEGDWHGLVILAATSGLRLGDGAGLKWRNLDTVAKLIKVKTRKTGAKLELPMHPDFCEWLQEQPTGIGEAPVFPSLSKTRVSGRYGLSDAFKRLMQKCGVHAGVGRQASKKSRGNSTSRKSFHSFRHFAASQMASAGIRAEVARSITGHADAKSHEGYVTPDLQAMRLAVAAISLRAIA